MFDDDDDDDDDNAMMTCMSLLSLCVTVGPPWRGQDSQGRLSGRRDLPAAVRSEQGRFRRDAQVEEGQQEEGARPLLRQASELVLAATRLDSSSALAALLCSTHSTLT